MAGRKTLAVADSGVYRDPVTGQHHVVFVLDPEGAAFVAERLPSDDLASREWAELAAEAERLNALDDDDE